MKLFGRKDKKQLAPYRGELVKANDITPMQKASAWPKVLLVAFFLGGFWLMGGKQLREIKESLNNPASQIVTGPNVTYLDRIDANPIAITTPEVSDWVLGQGDRVAIAADLEALEVNLKQIEIERQEIQNKQNALNVEGEYLDDNALRIQTQMYASLQNQLAELDIRRGETQRKIDEAKGLAEANAIEVKAMAEASDTAEKARIENIELEASAELEASLMQAEADKALAEAKRELAWASVYQSIAPLLSIFLLVLTCLLIGAGFAPLVARQFKKAMSNATAPVITTRPTPDAVDEVLGEAVRRATTPPPIINMPRRTPPKREQNSSQNSKNAPEEPRRAKNSKENSKNTQNSDDRTVSDVTADYPWTKKIFTPDELELIAGRLGGGKWTNGIVKKIAKLELEQIGKEGRKIKRDEIKPALGLNGTDYHNFFLIDVQNERANIVRSRGGSVATTTIER